MKYFIFAVFLIVCFYFSFLWSFLPLSYLWLHFSTAVNDKFAKINSRFLIVKAEAIGVEAKAEAIEK